MKTSLPPAASRAVAPLTQAAHRKAATERPPRRASLRRPPSRKPRHLEPSVVISRPPPAAAPILEQPPVPPTAPEGDSGAPWLRRLGKFLAPHLRPAKLATAPYPSVDVDCPLPVRLQVRGNLPADLRGTLYRNGPAQFEIYGKTLGHLFDGNGMAIAVHFDEQGVTYRSRFVATREKVHEDAERRHIYPSFGTLAPFGIFDRLRGIGSKNPANVNLVYFDNLLFALSDVGWAYRLDPETLETWGPDNLGLELPANGGFSAHPKLHQSTQTLWAFSMDYRGPAKLKLFAVPPRHGRVTHAAPISPFVTLDMPIRSVNHDFCLTETKAVFLLIPHCVESFPMGLVLGVSTPAKALHWHSETNTHIAIVDLQTKKQVWAQCPTIFSLHHVAAWDDAQGGVFIDTCAHPDPSVISLVGDDAQSDMGIDAKLTRLHVSATGVVNVETLSDTVIEFPRRSPQLQGKPYNTLFGLTLRPGSPRETVPVRLDLRERRSTVAPSAPGETAREGVPIPKAGAQNPESDVWLLSFVNVEATRSTELRVYDGAALADGAICTMELPQRVPADIHGNWVPEGSQAAAVD